MCAQSFIYRHEPPVTRCHRCHTFRLEPSDLDVSGADFGRSSNHYERLSAHKVVKSLVSERFQPFGPLAGWGIRAYRGGKWSDGVRQGVVGDDTNWAHVLPGSGRRGWGCGINGEILWEVRAHSRPQGPGHFAVEVPTGIRSRRLSQPVSRRLFGTLDARRV